MDEKKRANLSQTAERPLKIAIIGGGRRCRSLLEMIDAERFPWLNAEIVAVVEPNPNAVGVQLAREKGIFTTARVEDLYSIDSLDLVIELAGKEDLLRGFLKRGGTPKVQILGTTISRLFSDLIRLQEEHLFREKQLALIESIAETIFSSIRDRVMIMRPDMKVLDANNALLEWLGMGKDDVVGKYCYQITHRFTEPCYCYGIHCPLMECLETGGTGHSIHEHSERDGSTRYYEISTVPLRNPKGQIEVVLEIIRDITDELERRVEQKTKALKQDLARLIHEDKMIALGKLVASAVHEINNPLSGIHALAKLMRNRMEEDKPLSEDERKQFCYYLQLIDQESARCSNIVGNLLSFSRQQKLEKAYFNVNEIIRKVVLLSKHKMELQDISLKLELEESIPNVFGDPGQIQQCLVNLVFNAMEAMPNGGTLTIKTHYEEHRERVRIDVIDTGVGIPKEIISQIFEPFYSTKSKDKGVGLGLSVVYGIIKEHRGSIYVVSQVGKGSDFIVRLPCQEHSEREEGNLNNGKC
ncbi:MAG TPA: PAS domain-containing protein [Thermodesulforhabdus norvegica]|uniref:histidine kinase n=1 Tax=Thermodesulforhabdus norvegica TaxID=39841 RepID=A0A7C0WUA7_9BACT|nr:PAS domain-containing protein [Deltaproteobacteria bacterium]MBW2068791.1 PAS domain-containing protein [Deltaproteobacteria bacterium]HDL89366.1 PAS domain-containing protein [Thermodesulforhabdus norvegica]